MNENNISDKRLLKHFKGITFSKYKKSDAKKELLKNLNNGKIEQSCYWAGEFICAGHFVEVWDILFLFSSKYIHLGNPKLPIYLDLRLSNFKSIVNNGYRDNILKLRNNIKIRKLFAEIICVLCLSKKKHTFDNIKVSAEDFNITKIAYKLTADNVNYAKTIFQKEDPKELFIAINEFSWNITRAEKNSNTACWWLEWILGFEDICKRDKKKIFGERRHIPVDNKFQKNIIWMVWDSLLLEAKNRNKGLYKIIKALLNLFCLLYKQGVRKRRKYIIYYAINLLTETLDDKFPIISNIDLVKLVQSKINLIYKQIKKNEITPNTDYLFNNSITNNNLEKTIKRLDKMSTLTEMIPRNI